ncbi:YbaK/EbsC family protein [Streptomyces tsukubensis]|uniref:Aminoacyl-tRNA deacylase n=1 Tax=Streptomyces tsukubensis TaxID=83656 RepID=A0A1V4A4S0_9ACTN|nr:YbaK/EbsC family protein [Streptomyces tsukubensis]OON75973.1 aminoacyl-tRNA deacylase [Streptomyces tsukubensis]QFR94064.1 YbaK/EbsC family protein [Streptomyces tsukubensis]
MTIEGPETKAAQTVHPRFAQALEELGLVSLTADVRRFPEATRTAQEAAAAVGCELSAIVKSLIFTAELPGADTDNAGTDNAGTENAGTDVPVLVLMDGASRVDVERVRAELGAAKVRRAKAEFVRETTGFAIGGVPPFGHRTKTLVLADKGLLDHPVVWAAAGTPHAVFPMEPAALIAHAGGSLVDVREGAQ